MTGEEFVLAIIAMVMGSVVLIVGITQISKLIRSWLNRNNNAQFSDEEFSRLAKAFMQHKKDMERRVQNIEALITEEAEEQEPPISYPELEESGNESTLQNDLDKKRRVR